MSVEVMSGGGSANLQSKSILPSSLPYTASPDNGYDGFSTLTVQKPPLLLPENIKSGVSLFGVDGNYTGGDRYLLYANSESANSEQIRNFLFNSGSVLRSQNDTIVAFYLYSVETVAAENILLSATGIGTSITTGTDWNGYMNVTSMDGKTAVNNTTVSLYETGITISKQVYNPHFAMAIRYAGVFLLQENK